MNNEKRTYRVLGMRCAGCAANVEGIAKRQPGVCDASVNLAAKTLTVETDGSLDPEGLRHAISDVGFEMLDDDETAERRAAETERRSYATMRRDTIAAWALVVAVVALNLLTESRGAGLWLQCAAALAALVVPGRAFFRGAWKQARHGSTNMDTLVALSTSVSFLFSLAASVAPDDSTAYGARTYYEANVMIIAFVLTGKMLEERAKRQTRTSIERLMRLRPQTARVVRDGREQTVAASELRAGDIIIVRTGEQVAADGDVTEGRGQVDESMISGEPLPVEKEPGSRVKAGTTNRDGAFRMRATTVGRHTTLARIIATVREAQGSKAPAQRLADKAIGVFVPTVITLSLLTLCAWAVVGGDLPGGVGAAVAVLVIACPCALGLATPTAIMVGMGRAADEHILIKDAAALEELRRADTMVFDKTGTLTVGSPSVEGWEWTAAARGREAELTAVALAAEGRSTHPLAVAIAEWIGRERPTPSAEADEYASVAGRGVRLTAGGKEYWMGNARMAGEMGAEPGYTPTTCNVVYMGQGAMLLATVTLRDRVKASAAAAVGELKKMGIRTAMLTGDRREAAEEIAAQTGMDEVVAEATPEAKLEYVRRKQSEGRRVAMVGDGINDSPALAQADISIAMGNGADIAMDVAQVTLTTSDPTLLPRAVRLSRKTARIIRQNLFWACIYNVVAIPLAAGALYPAWGLTASPAVASAAMALSSFCVVMNSLRIRTIDN